MLKVFATNVVISKGYDNNPALRFHRDENTNSRSVRFRIGKKIYDSRAENNSRWLNYNVKAYNGVCGRIEKMNLEEGSYINIIGRLDEENWNDNDGNPKSAPVIILDDIEYAGVGKPKTDSSNGNGQTGNAVTNNTSEAPQIPAHNAVPSDNFTGYQNFGGNGGMFDEN